MHDLDLNQWQKISMAELKFQDWGLIDYEEALLRQTDLIEKVLAEKAPGILVFCTHPPVVTLGRSSRAEDVYAWSGRCVEVTRGGRATYHGPSQIVIYPILNLEILRKGRRERDVAAYLKTFEEALAEVIREYGIANVAAKSSNRDQGSGEADITGVWVGDRKLVSVGVGVKKWVTFHGAAINVSKDPLAFQGLNPCGYPPETMISLEELTGSAVDIPEFKSRLKRKLLSSL